MALVRRQLGRDDRHRRAAIRFGAAEALLQHAILLEDDLPAVGLTFRRHRAANRDTGWRRPDAPGGDETRRPRFAVAVVWRRLGRPLDRLRIVLSLFRSFRLLSNRWSAPNAAARIQETEAVRSRPDRLGRARREWSAPSVGLVAASD